MKHILYLTFVFDCLLFVKKTRLIIFIIQRCTPDLCNFEELLYKMMCILYKFSQNFIEVCMIFNNHLDITTDHLNIIFYCLALCLTMIAPLSFSFM